MTWFADLTPYTYTESDRRTLNIGWLALGQPFATGEVARPVLDRLDLLASTGYGGPVFMGFHTCELCGNAHHGGEIRAIGADGTRYAAPRLVLHYIEAHGYAPPQAFLDAVMRVTLTQVEAEAQERCLSCGDRLTFLADTAALVRDDPARADPYFCPACETHYLRPRRRR